MKASKTSCSDSGGDAKTEPVSVKANPKADDKTAPVLLKPTIKTDAKTAPVSERVALKRDDKTARVSERAILKPDAKTAPVSERVALKRDDKTAPVSERIPLKPDAKTAPVSERGAFKPDGQTSPVSTRLVPWPSRRQEKGPEIPNYRILHRIGKGGYGEVWLARSVTGALRAVKVVRRSDFGSDRAFEREFEGIQRFEPVSQEHSSLVDILYVGRDVKQGFYYYVMELADDVERGREINVDDYQPLTLSRKMRHGEKSDLADCLELGIALADGLSKLHENKLAHRDVKPSNIIYVRGKPRLADPGLVAQAGQETFVGTEGYVPPEGPGTPKADLYSIGIVLYEMNTGKERMDFPELPTIIDPSEPNLRERSELNTIICRACAPRPKQRYADARALSEALNGIGKATKAPGRGVWKLAAAAIVTGLLGAGVYAGMTFGYLDFSRTPDWGSMLASATHNEVIEVALAPVEPEIVAGVENPPPNLAQVVVPPVPALEAPPSPKPAPPAPAAAEPDPVQEVAALRAVPIVPGPSVGSEQPAPEVIVLPESGAVDPVGPETAPSPGVPQPAHAAGDLRINSFPPGAVVFMNDKEIGATPLQLDELPADDYKLRFELENHKEQTSIARIEPGKTALVDIELPFWKPPVAGRSWDNSVGMLFEPISPDHGHRSVGAVREDGFAAFAKALGSESINFKTGLEHVVFADEPTRQAYCEWMTANDRANGYLDQKLVYIQDVADPLDGSPDLASFYAIVGEARFGRVIVSSEPAGADVFQDGKKIGATPLEIERVRLGPVAYEVRKAGFRGVVVEGQADHLNPLELNARLTPNQSVVFEEEWTNHIGMKFVPVGGILVAIYETRIQDYEKYWATIGDPDRYFEADFDQGQNHPVVNVRIDHARAFCEWLTEVEREQERIQPNHVYRLPTDEEWSRFAGLTTEVGSSPEARDGKIRGVFPWGESWPPPEGAGNFGDVAAKGARAVRYQITGYNDGFARTAPVGSFRPNEHGLHDMAGNVWEYVNDNYSARSGGGPYPVVMRGGSWQDYRKENFETAHRNVSAPDRSHPLWGFRVVLAHENEPIEIQATVAEKQASE